jgi:hypothetical protein
MSIDRAPMLAQGGDMAMELYPEMAAAMQADDVDRCQEHFEVAPFDVIGSLVCASHGGNFASRPARK